jgi:hypothetical protein
MLAGSLLVITLAVLFNAAATAVSVIHRRITHPERLPA